MPDIKDALEKVDTLDEAVGLSMGYASMCWEPRPAGVFDSTRASEATDELIEWIRNRYILGDAR